MDQPPAEPGERKGFFGNGWMLRLLVAVLALGLVVGGLLRLGSATRPLSILETREGGVPITLYRPVGDAPAPVVVIAHGFAGSRHLMQAYAVTLARNGYIAVTFDFPGHGRNARPFLAGFEDQEARLGLLTEALEAAVALGLRQPGADGRLALLGHSMAGDVLARFAVAGEPKAGALVLVSPYLSATADTLRAPNLLLVYGALEPALLHEQGRTTIRASTPGEVATDQTYGDPSAGNARRLVLAPGVEHIGVLYSEDALAESLGWLDRTFDRTGTGYIDRRGTGLGLLFAGILALAWPLSRLLPRVVEPPRGAGLPWRRLLPVAIVPAMLTPLILWKVPSDFLPILLGDYIALHFALYGLLTIVGVRLVRSRRAARPAELPAEPPGSGPVSLPALVAATGAATLYAALAFAVPIDRYLTVMLPGPERWHLVAAILAGTLIYFLSDEWATRGPGAAAGGYWLTKLLFLGSLLLAVALNLRELFFLIIIVPAILILFLVYGLLSRWIYARTGHPAVAAIANATAFAGAIATSFPLAGF